jgi:hypothetical protein
MLVIEVKIAKRTAAPAIKRLQKTIAAPLLTGCGNIEGPCLACEKIFLLLDAEFSMGSSIASGTLFRAVLSTLSFVAIGSSPNLLQE